MGEVLLIGSGLISFLIVLLMLLSLSLQVVRVQGESMAPALSPGDRILIWRLFPTLRLHEGQVVLLSQEDTSLRAAPYLKRIIALQGEICTLRPHLEQETRYLASEQTWHIPPGYIFVCGDNLKQSIDSRLWGPLPRSRVLGIMLKKLNS